MWRSAQLAILSLVVLGQISPGFGQFDGEFPNNYNLPKMFEKVSSILRTSRDIEELRSDPDVVSVWDQYKDLFSKEAIKGFLKDLLADVDQERCSQDIDYVFDNLTAKDQWGLKMLDAMGKPESGILEGNIKWIGNYHECTRVYVPLNENGTAGDFNGQYCSMGLSVAVFNKVLPLTLGVCLPDSCGSVTVEELKKPQMGNTFNITQKVCQPLKKRLTPAAVAVICLLSIFFLLALIGSSITVYEYIVKLIKPEKTVFQYSMRVNDEEDLEKHSQDSAATSTPKADVKENKGWYGTAKEFFNCFCLFTNGEKLLNTDGTEGQLLCLHGIRFLSMTWVILCHTYGMIVVGLSNVLEAAATIDTFLFQVILNGFFCVDSFFLLSGFLVAHLYFQETAKTKREVPWLYFYIHRFIRLTPVYMMVLGVVAALNYYFGSGPFWPITEVDPVCQTNWWYNILYINNFMTKTDHGCMGWTWYLANDMQFFIVSPIFLITLRRWPSIGYSLIGIFMSATIGANFGITYYNKLQTGYGSNFAGSALNMDMTGLLQDQNTFMDQIYSKPYTRMSPYLIGIALAFYLFKRKQDNAGKLNRVTLVCGWIIAAAMALTCQFYLYHRILSVVETGFYNALSHAGFTLGLGWVIFTCLIGQAGPVNGILSFKLFIPLSRLTYSAYLIHLLIVGGYFQSLKTTLQFSHITLVTLFLGLLVMVYAVSFLVSALFESPVIRLEKLIRTKLKS